MGERVSSDDLAALLFRERCFILDGLITFSCERVADAVILLPLLISPRAVVGKPAFRYFSSFSKPRQRGSFAREGFYSSLSYFGTFVV